MKKLSKAQRQQIMAIAIVAPLLMVALYFYCITPQYDRLTGIAGKTKDMEKKLHDAEIVNAQGAHVAAELDACRELLQKREATMSPDRDAYAWIIETINPFVQSRKGVTISSYSQPDYSDNGILLNFPYRWATFHLKGYGYYYEYGRFFADLENSFPYFRVQNLQISANSGIAAEPEKLSYNFDLISPVATNSP